MSVDEFTHFDGPYLLGALSPQERRDYETHLNGCGVCADFVRELAGLPPMTPSGRRLPDATDPLPETVLPSLARAVRRERARRRLAACVAAAAACLIAVSAVAVTRPGSTAQPPSVSPASTPASTPATPASTPLSTQAGTPGATTDLALTAVIASPVTASARLISMDWGTRIDLTCAYRPKRPGTGAQLGLGGEGVPYALVVIDRNGAAEQVATWRGLPNRQITLMGASSRARPDIATVEIRTISGRAILRLVT